MAIVKVLKPHLSATGFVRAGDEIELDEHRQRALARNGIVPPLQGEEPKTVAGGVKHALTNSDFKPRRETMTLPSKAEPAPSAPATNGGTAKAK
ncbi:hypothetical protein V1281_002590 [Nitrobacteraceae bacterium AZCC 2161]